MKYLGIFLLLLSSGYAKTVPANTVAYRVATTLFTAMESEMRPCNDTLIRHQVTWLCSSLPNITQETFTERWNAFTGLLPPPMHLHAINPWGPVTLQAAALEGRHNQLYLMQDLYILVSYVPERVEHELILGITPHFRDSPTSPSHSLHYVPQ